VREWERSKAPYRGKKTADVVAELIAAKRREQLSNPYVNRLEDDLKSFAAVVPEEIERVQAPHIKAFLNGCQVGPRRWNNLRDQIVTLFRFARSERYLPKDRTTEAEDVAKMKVARKTVEVFTSEELQIILENCRSPWSPWIVLSAFAGIRTFEVLRMDWSNVRWEQKLIDLPPEVTKVNERRMIPMCDALIEALTPWQKTTGPVCQAKVPQREIEQIAAKVKNTHPGFRWKHNALRHAYGSYRTALTQNVPQVALEMGNSIQKVKRH
jgi:integrase